VSRLELLAYKPGVWQKVADFDLTPSVRARHW
jgi:hypothetical protein